MRSEKSAFAPTRQAQSHSLESFPGNGTRSLVKLSENSLLIWQLKDFAAAICFLKTLPELVILHHTPQHFNSYFNPASHAYSNIPNALQQVCLGQPKLPCFTRRSLGIQLDWQPEAESTARNSRATATNKVEACSSLLRRLVKLS